MDSPGPLAARNANQRECRQQQHAARRCQLFNNRPEELFHQAEKARAAIDPRHARRIHVAGIETIAGVRVFAELRPKIAQPHALSHALPELPMTPTKLMLYLRLPAFRHGVRELRWFILIF